MVAYGRLPLPRIELQVEGLARISLDRMYCQHLAVFYVTVFVRACLYGDRGPQEGEVTHLPQLFI